MGEDRMIPKLMAQRDAPELAPGEGSPPPATVGRHASSTDDRTLHVPPIDEQTFKVPLTIREMLGLFAISFSYGFVFNSLNSIVVPKEIDRLMSENQSMWLGLVMAAGAFCQLAAPVMGAWSDRTGRRMPFLIHGSVITIVGLSIFIAIINVYSLMLLLVAHMCATVGLSIQYAIMTSLLSDCVAEDQVGTGSGVIAMLAMLGSGFGYGMFACKFSLASSYFGYIMAIVICLSFSIGFLPKSLDRYLVEVSRRLKRGEDRPRRGPHSAGISIFCMYDVLASLSPPSPAKHPDFAWACLSRSLFNAGLSGQVYLVYYFRDVVHVTDPVQAMSWVAVMALLGGILAAIPSGIMSDQVGKKPLVYVSIGVTILALSLFMLAESLSHLLLIGLIFGVGNVAYLSVDYAIGVQVLPRSDDVDTPPRTPKADPRLGRMLSSVTPHSHDSLPSQASFAIPRRMGTTDAAKDLGLFAMAATLGQLVGQLVYGAVLQLYAEKGPDTPETHYSHWGYIAVYSIGGVMFLLSGLCMHFIQEVQ
eukprot:GGOE01040989.1.p1 GENE.GGOE01040989.1~~GGOE01040989.1.p1  ORF type:complete len:532 (+),score=155.63 GGOE01040989.1:65-1660(+)